LGFLPALLSRGTTLGARRRRTCGRKSRPAAELLEGASGFRTDSSADLFRCRLLDQPQGFATGRSESGDELQRLAETCNAMLARLESAVTQLRQFTADASHELRGPLSFTRTVAEVALRNAHADPDSRRAFEDIVEEATKAAVLLDEMLTLARADAGPANLTLEPVDLHLVVDEVCAMAGPIARQNGQNLAVVGSNAGPVPTVLGDFSSLRRLVWILLDNALKYTAPQGTIEVSLAVVSESATLTVRDNGIGISPEDLPRIFDRFYRADPSRGMVEGNGLGLSIAKWIAETHRAALSVTSEEHVGTIFRLSFPLADLGL
jgi:signal transduction histidine kinase